MEVFPGDDLSTDDISGMISELIRNKLLVEFQAEGESYWHVTGWKHQKIDRPTYRYPRPQFDEHSTSDRRAVADRSPPEGKGEEGIGGEGKGEESASTDAATSDQSPDRKPARYSFTDADMEIANWMFSLVQQTCPGAKRPNIDAWANEVRLLRERDGRTPETIRGQFQWANQDGFWRANILSPSKLREKWDQLTAQMARPQRGNRSSPNMSFNATRQLLEGPKE